MSEKLDQHALIQALQSLAIELGRTPNRDEFARHIRHRKIIDELGGYAVLIQAAGLDAPLRSRKPLTNAIFEQSIESHLADYKPKPMAERKPYSSMAVISDIHWPFHCQRVIDRYLEWIEEKKPEFAIINGDAWDMYSHAKFPRSHNQFTPKQEESSARAGNEEFWKSVHSLSPKTKCYQLLGNHDVRPVKRVLEAVPTMEHWIEAYFKSLFTFEGVETIFDHRQELIFGDVMVFHGYRSGLGDHRDFTGFNCIIGHTHKPGIVYKSMGVGHEPKWEANCGLAGDPMAKGLTYTPQKATGWTQSFLSLDKDGPRIIVC